MAIRLLLFPRKQKCFGLDVPKASSFFDFFFGKTTSYVCKVFIESIRVYIVNSLCFGSTEVMED